MIDAASGREYHIFGAIILGDKVFEIVTRESLDALAWAKDGAAKGLIGVGFFLKPVKDHIVRRINGLSDFLQPEKALDTPDEPAAWVALARIRRLAFVGAALPAWIAALAVFAGLPALPLMLLALSSLVLLYLYRIPRQLG